MARPLTMAAVVLLLAAPACADALLDGFRAPPPAARPRVWWHWMNGNITRGGIKADLDWMKSVGIGGVDAIDASIDTPQVVKKRIVYMSPEWKKTFRYAAGLADKYGLELMIDSSPGWSETGGPWVTPQAAMKKLVWSETRLDGGKPFHVTLPAPPSVPGPFQDIRKAAANVPDFYRDALVIAYRDPVETPQPALSSDAGPVNALDDLTRPQRLTPAHPEDEVRVQADYAAPTQIQGLTLALATNDDQGFAARVEASDDGVTWRRVADVPPAAQVRRFALLQQTIAFAPVTARRFRLVVRPAPPLPTSLRIVDRAPGLAEPPSTPKPLLPRFYDLYRLTFHAEATVNEFEKKAGFAIARDNYAIANTDPAAPGTAIARADVIDIIGRTAADGTLDWTPPPGRWTVLRMGYSLTGSENHPATPEATGLEVDKLSAPHVRDYITHYLDTYAVAAGPDLFARRGLTSLLVDSTEVGAQNWTETILSDFRRLRGYDPTPFLPALTGHVVESTAASDRFLWDWRRTIAELLAQNHYGQIARVAKERGLFQYGEALEDHRPTFGDDIDMRRFADAPMGAMWAYGQKTGPLPTYVADLLGAASVAHVYGRKLVAAESLTSAGQPWSLAPRDLKPVADLEFVLGVNRMMIHTSVHQPVDRAPGLSLNGYGQFFNRLENWAAQAGGWMRYLARCQFLLQQGRPAADIAYFTGQGAPLTGLFGDKAPDMPAGHGFDFIGSDALLHLLSVEHGDLVTPSGMRYRLLYLGGSSRFMTLDALRRISALAAEGATIVGTKPEASPSQADDQDAFHRESAALFASARVFSTLDAAFVARQLTPDFDYTKAQPDTQILFTHRHLDDGELYFISNRRDRDEAMEASFRVTGLNAELLDPVSGDITPASVVARDGRSYLALRLPAYGSAFVVFRKSVPLPGAGSPMQRSLPLGNAPWAVRFQPGRGAPARKVFTTLQSWSAREDLKYFSGWADYSRDFDLPPVLRGHRLLLDLGDVHEVADVTLNGRKLGTVWTSPFALDITPAARSGRNHLVVRVANLWVNRLIGDAQPGAVHKFTFTTIPTFRPDAPLRPSGLLGPVRLLESWSPP